MRGNPPLDRKETPEGGGEEREGQGGGKGRGGGVRGVIIPGHARETGKGGSNWRRRRRKEKPRKEKKGKQWAPVPKEKEEALFLGGEGLEERSRRKKKPIFHFGSYVRSMCLAIVKPMPFYAKINGQSGVPIFGTKGSPFLDALPV